MKTFIIFSLLIIISFNVSSQRKVNCSDTLIDKTSNKYYSSEINYFIFYSDKNSITKLNDSINSFINGQKVAIKDDLDDNIKAEMDSGFISGKYMQIINTDYHILDNGIVSCFFEVYYYTLGAHGNTSYFSIHYNTLNNKFIEFSNIAKINGQDDLDNFNLLLKKYFVNTDSCYSSEPKLETENYNSYFIDDDFITIVFPAYELGAYACGAAFVKIPIKELKK